MGSTPSPFSFESLADHDRIPFTCGITELDNYLHQQAGQDAKRKVAAPFVMVDETRQIVGYYTLSAYGVRSTELPPQVAKKLPKYPLIPATLLGRLAVSREHQGQKLGRLLLMDALYRSWKNTTQVASAGVVAEALDNSAREFYLHHEFIPLLAHSRKLFIAMGTIEKLFG
ncbi:MAG TPA: GNAT family N-acetyltransferase [Bryobacteraceae bacterium]|nr:GNAT family N-acetyltransferase [Bryobacteraceae bacterium]